MDKKNTVIGVLLLAAAFVLITLTPKPVPPPAKPIAAQPAASTAGGSVNVAAGSVSTGATANASANPKPASAAPATATITTLSNALVEVHFTDLGGAIRDVALKNYPAVQGKPAPYVFNAAYVAEIPNTDPMLAFVDLPGLDRNTGFQIVSQSANEIVYRAVLNGTLEVTRRYVLAPDSGKTSDPYQLRHETTFRNLSEQTTVPLPVALSLGTVAPTNPMDLGQYTSAGYASGGSTTFITRTALDRGYGWLFGLGTHEPPPPIARVAPITWAAVKNQFFTSIFTPDAPATGLLTHRVKVGEIPPGEQNENKAYGLTGLLQTQVPAIAPRAEEKIAGEFYVGPKEYGRLANSDVFKADQDKVMEFGKFFGVFSQLLNKLMTWMNTLVGNWGIAIILTTLTLKIATLPLTLKASKSMKRMQKLAPEMKLIREKYKDNPQKQQVAMVELYKQHKVNPVGGCIPMLLPMPFFIGFYSMLQGTAELRFAPFLWAHDLSMPDTVGHVFGYSINILPLLLGATMIVQMQLTPQPNIDKAQATMMRFVPLIFLVICYNFSCALALYSTVNGLFTIGQQVFINRMKDDGDPATLPSSGGKGMKNVTPKKSGK